jgi:hypothetical protein
MPLLEFPLFRWIRDLLGIRKDIIDTKKSKLEIQKLQDEELSRNLITRATISDIEKYDPKIGIIKAAALSGTESLVEKDADIEICKRNLLSRLFWTFGLLGLIFALYKFISRISKSLSK